MCFRFDLIFLILDPQDEVFDRRLANHLVSLYYQGTEEQEQEYLVRLNITVYDALSMGSLVIILNSLPPWQV